MARNITGDRISEEATHPLAAHAHATHRRREMTGLDVVSDERLAELEDRALRFMECGEPFQMVASAVTTLMLCRELQQYRASADEAIRRGMRELKRQGEL
jgi:hypothetical protein